MFRSLLVASALFALVGCSTQPKPAMPKPVIKSIAIIPATDPSRYILENVSAVQFVIPLAATFNYLDSKEKAKTFNDKLRSERSTLASTFTEEMARALRAYGFEVQILSDVARSSDEPDAIDYDKISSPADAILHLRFTEVGLFSPRSSSNYIPRVNAYGTLVVKGREDYIYDQEIYYGVDSRKGKTWSIESDEKFTYPTFDAVMSRLDEIRNAFDTGAREISKRMSTQVRDSIK